MKDLKNIPPHYSHTKSYRVLSKKKKKKANKRRTDFSSRKMGTMTESLSLFFLSKYFTITLEGHKRKEKSLDSKITSFRAEIFFAYRESRGGLALLFTDVTHGEARERKRSRGPVLVR